MSAQGGWLRTHGYAVSRAIVLLQRNGEPKVNEGQKTNGRPRRSKSEGGLSPGLYLVATPIGNADDITLRAIHVLRAADAVFAEDTRVTAKLLTLHGLTRPLHSYREHNAARAEQDILRHLGEGRAVALVSDAGTPLISDPGQRLVRAVVSQGFTVTPVPGASAPLAALTASGLAGERFLFAGFLPQRGTERRRVIRELVAAPATLVFFEAPSRVGESLADLAAILGPRPAAVAREVTKLHEEFRRAPLDELAVHYESNAARGEIVIVVVSAAF